MEESTGDDFNFAQREHCMNILLIHGLGRTPLSMRSLSQALAEAGHQPMSFGYTTLTESFDEIVGRLRDRLQVLSQNPPYGVVTHSMGGVLVRAALSGSDPGSDLAEPALLSPAHVVMLAPPNQSPRLARIACHLPPFLWFAGQSGQNLASKAFYESLPKLTCPYTLITGNIGITGSLSPFGSEINDLVVGSEESKMYPYDKLIEVPAPHSFIMNNKLAQSETLRAFANTLS